MGTKGHQKESKAVPLEQYDPLLNVGHKRCKCGVALARDGHESVKWCANDHCPHTTVRTEEGYYHLFPRARPQYTERS